MSLTQLLTQNETNFLNLNRPLIFFDLETTGTDCMQDRIIEISAIKHNPDGTHASLYYLLNPTIPIPEEATEVHGFTNEMVAGQPRFCDVAEMVHQYFKDCDLAGYNIRRFDIPFLMEEFHRCKLYPILLTETKVVDAYSIYAKKHPRDLTAAVKQYCNEDFDNAHSAQADVEATIKVLKHQLLHHGDLEPNTSFLHSYSCDSEQIIDFSGKFGRNKLGQIVYKFGKYKNKVVNLDNKEHQDYFSWITDKSNPSVEMQMAVRRIKSQHKSHKSCMEWLQQKNIITDVAKSFALYKSLLSEGEFKPFIVARNGKKLIVTYTENAEPPLVLADEDSKHISLLILKNYFNAMGGLEYIQSTFST